jgi:hypothetical protein
MQWYDNNPNGTMNKNECGDWAHRDEAEEMEQEYWRMKSKLNAIRWLCLRVDEMDNKARDRKQGDD